MSLFENLNSIYSIKNDIKSVLEDKGIDMTIYSFPDYPSVINDLSTGGNMSTLSVSENGTYYPETGYDGFSEVSVNVIPNLGYDYVFSSNGFYNPEDYGYDGFAKIGVSVPSPQFVTDSLSVSVNGTYTPGQGVDGFSQVVVDVPQSVSGIDEKEYTEGKLNIVNISNSASFVADYVYSNRTNIQTVYLPNCLYVGLQAFGNCTSLYSVELPICKSLYNVAFGSCYSLQSISLPNCEYLGYQVFGSCSNLTKIDLPNLISTSGSPFIKCINLSEISIPNCEYLSNYAFQECSALTKLVLPKCSHLGNSVFFKCINLSEVTIEYSSVCEIGVIAASWTGVVYVPSSLVDSYKTALNWSTISSRIFPISE